jgi:hypothetical protein
VVITRRQFLHQSSLLAATLTTGKSGVRNAMTHAVPTMSAALDVSNLAQFVDPLPLPEIAQRQGYRPSSDDPNMSVPFLSDKGPAHCH